MKRKLFIICVFAIFAVKSFSVTWHIKQDGSGDFTTIQAGINASAHGDIVLVYPGTYFENINYNGKNITVASLEMTTNDPQYISQTIIDGQRLSSCVAIVSGETDTILRGLTITNGQGISQYPLWSGGVSIWGEMGQMVQVDIINCVVTENYSPNAAGIVITDGIVHLSGCSIRRNYSLRFCGGIGIRDYSQVTFDSVNRCNIYDNFAGSGMDIVVETIHFNYLNVIVDTFTVSEPDRYFAQVFPGNMDFLYEFDILESYIELIDNDLYVSPDGNDNNSGLTPDDPLKTINLAVRNIVSNRDHPHNVYLSSGIYSKSLNQQIFAFGCKSYVSIIGESMYTTIIDGEISGEPFLYSGSEYNNSTIKNITFQNGAFENSLINLYYSDLITFESVIIQNSIITNIGAAIVSSTSGGNIQLNNVTVDNISVLDGNNSGAMFNGTTSFKAENCTFSNNSCSGSTGLSAGLYVMSSGDIEINNCKFINNRTVSTTWQGYASAFLCTDYNDVMGNTYINNCLFTDNTSIGGRSTIYAKSLIDGRVSFTNNTVVDNQATYGIEFKGNIDLRNNIIRNSSYYEIQLNIIDPGIYSTLNVSYNNIDGGQNAIHNAYNLNTINWLEGNIDEDPLFLEYGDDPYQLSATSPCIDTGTPDISGFSLPPWDLLNNHRDWDGDGNGIAVIDMGCYEYGSEPYVGSTQHLVPNTTYGLTNYPNPFNPSTTISFELTAKDAKDAKLEIYNIKGQKVKTLMDCRTAPGKYNCIWNGRNEAGKRVSSGEYIARLTINGEEKAVRKMMVVK